MKWKVTVKHDFIRDMYNVYVYTVPQTSDEPKYAMHPTKEKLVEVAPGAEPPIWAEVAGEHKSLLDAFANMTLIEEVERPWNKPEIKFNTGGIVR